MPCGSAGLGGVRAGSVRMYLARRRAHGLAGRGAALVVEFEHDTGLALPRVLAHAIKCTRRGIASVLQSPSANDVIANVRDNSERDREGGRWGRESSFKSKTGHRSRGNPCNPVEEEERERERERELFIEEGNRTPVAKATQRPSELKR